MAQERQQLDLARTQTEKSDCSSDTPVLGGDGAPLVMISASAAELIPTRQYGNVTVGPVVVKRWVPDGDEEHLMREVRKVQQVCEQAVAEDRETVHNLIRQSEQGRALP